MRATGHSIWLMPAGPAYDELAAAIVVVGNRHGSPCFPPHVTLIGHLSGAEAEVLAEAAVLATHLQPFEIQLVELHASNHFFRAVVAEVEATVALLAARAAAREIFGRHADAPYRPHLSLAYGTLSDSLLADARQAFDRIVTRRFGVASLHVFRTEGDVADWRAVAELDFGRWV